jgi:hypothetical protein
MYRSFRLQQVAVIRIIYLSTVLCVVQSALTPTTYCFTTYFSPTRMRRRFNFGEMSSIYFCNNPQSTIKGVLL